mmetsp:Transcript_79819/g.229105  ORF Transcript_79819/g.229105 Transcript_79819/m.229105 type:complete len:248 (+) Transcript_79819:269-1012(+)
MLPDLEAHDHDHDEAYDHGNSILLDHGVETQLARHVLELLGLVFQVVCFPTHGVQVLSSLQDLVDILAHDVRHLRQVLVQPAQCLAGLRVPVLRLLLRDLPIEFDEVVGLLDGLDARPVVHGTGAVLALQLLLEKPLDISQECEGQVLRVALVEQRHEANTILHRVVEHILAGAIDRAPIRHVVQLPQELLRLLLLLWVHLVGIIPSLHQDQAVARAGDECDVRHGSPVLNLKSPSSSAPCTGVASQ